jgi:V/A-type H+-transporting ATPase subunit E
MPKLEEILADEASGEIDKITAEADARAEKIVSDAKTQAEERLAAHKKELEAEAKAAASRARSAADLIVANARTKARGEVLDLLLEKVRHAIDEIPSQPDYSDILKALAAEAFEAAGGAAAFVVNPDDRGRLEEWVREQGAEIKEDPELRLGVRLVNQQGNAIENTLPERLRRVFGTLAPEVAIMLWGEEGP